MPLNTKTFEQYLSDIITTWAGLLFLSPNLQSGDPLRAVFEATVLGGLIFIQSQAVRINKLTRAATSDGDDLDSYMADYGFERESATFAEGTATFAVNQVKTSNILIEPGIVIQTLGGKVRYQVIADTTKSGWSATQNAYVLTAGDLSVDCTVQALDSGPGSNVQALQLVQLVSSVSGINTVRNVAPILNGLSAETDEDFRKRFILAFNSVDAEGTILAILKAATGVQNGLDVKVVEFIDQNDNPREAFFMVVVDDGSGAPPSLLLDAVYLAVDRVRGGGIRFAVFGPVLITAIVSVNIRVSSSDVIAAAEIAILDYINTLKISEILYISQIDKTIMNVPGVVAIQPASLVCGQADGTPTNRTVYRSSNLHVTIGTY